MKHFFSHPQNARIGTLTRFVILSSLVFSTAWAHASTQRRKAIPTKSTTFHESVVAEERDGMILYKFTDKLENVGLSNTQLIWTQGVLWFGTWTGGVVRFDPKNNTARSYQPTTSNGPVMANILCSFGQKLIVELLEVERKADGDVWPQRHLGTFGFSKGRWILLRQESRLHNAAVANGVLWYADTKQGLVGLNLRSGRSTSIPLPREGFSMPDPLNRVNDIRIDRSGIWLAIGSLHQGDDPFMGSGLLYRSGTGPKDKWLEFNRDNSAITKSCSDTVSNGKRLYVAQGYLDSGLGVLEISNRKWSTRLRSDNDIELSGDGLAIDGDHVWITGMQGGGYRMVQYNLQTKLAQEHLIPDGVESGHEVSSGILQPIAGPSGMWTGFSTFYKRNAADKLKVRSGLVMAPKRSRP